MNAFGGVLFTVLLSTIFFCDLSSAASNDGRSRKASKHVASTSPRSIATTRRIITTTAPPSVEDEEYEDEDYSSTTEEEDDDGEGYSTDSLDNASLETNQTNYSSSQPVTTPAGPEENATTTPSIPSSPSSVSIFLRTFASSTVPSTSDNPVINFGTSFISTSLPSIKMTTTMTGGEAIAVNPFFTRSDSGVASVQNSHLVLPGDGGSSPTTTATTKRVDVDETTFPVDDDDSTITTEGSGLASFTLNNDRRPSNAFVEGSGDGPIDPDSPIDQEGDEDLEEGSGAATPAFGGGYGYPLQPKPVVPPRQTDKTLEEQNQVNHLESFDDATTTVASTKYIPDETRDGDEPANINTIEEDEIAKEILSYTDEPTFKEKPSPATQTLLAQPAMLAAVIGGAVIGLLCAILLVMYLVYRMRKKDEGSYALDEPTKRPGGYMRAPTNSGKEYYA